MDNEIALFPLVATDDGAIVETSPDIVAYVLVADHGGEAFLARYSEAERQRAWDAYLIMQWAGIHSSLRRVA